MEIEIRTQVRGRDVTLCWSDGHIDGDPELLRHLGIEPGRTPAYANPAALVRFTEERLSRRVELSYNDPWPTVPALVGVECDEPPVLHLANATAQPTIDLTNPAGFVAP